MSWLDDVVNLHKEFEPPLSFWRWAAIASISAAVKDNVWLERGGSYYKLYPNIYVMYHADSGMKKGPPVSMAKQLVRICNNTRIISGRSSIQGILKELGTHPQSHTEPGGKVVVAEQKSTAFICSSELTSSIVEDRVATDILTDLYDRQYNPGTWKSLLKMESFDLKDPTITMLTATNEGHSLDFFKKKDYVGGYFARTFIIQESERNRPNDLIVPPEFQVDYTKLAEYLKSITKLRGAFQSLGSRTETDIHKKPWRDEYSPETHYLSEAGLIFRVWYKNFEEARRQIKDPTGTLNRFDDSVLKVAMLLSLSKSTNMIIDSETMESAIAICETLVGNIRKVTSGRTGDESSDTMRKRILLEEVYSAPNNMISRTRLLKKYWAQGNSDEWDKCAATFIEAGTIVIDKIGESLVFKMPDEIVKEYTKFFGGKMK